MQTCRSPATQKHVANKHTKKVGHCKLAQALPVHLVVTEALWSMSLGEHALKFSHPPQFPHHVFLHKTISCSIVSCPTSHQIRSIKTKWRWKTQRFNLPNLKSQEIFSTLKNMNFTISRQTFNNLTHCTSIMGTWIGFILWSSWFKRGATEDIGTRVRALGLVLGKMLLGSAPKVLLSGSVSKREILPTKPLPSCTRIFLELEISVMRQRVWVCTVDSHIKPCSMTEHFSVQHGKPKIWWGVLVTHLPKFNESVCSAWDMEAHQLIQPDCKTRQKTSIMLLKC